MKINNKIRYKALMKQGYIFRSGGFDIFLSKKYVEAIREMQKQMEEGIKYVQVETFVNLHSTAFEEAIKKSLA